jgi:hypothetical protein
LRRQAGNIKRHVDFLENRGIVYFRNPRNQPKDSTRDPKPQARQRVYDKFKTSKGATDPHEFIQMLQKIDPYQNLKTT